MTRQEVEIPFAYKGGRGVKGDGYGRRGRGEADELKVVVKDLSRWAHFKHSLGENMSKIR